MPKPVASVKGQAADRPVTVLSETFETMAPAMRTTPSGSA